MPITERTLRKWRKESLSHRSFIRKVITQPSHELEPFTTKGRSIELHERILRMTQELMDQYLLRKETK